MEKYKVRTYPDGKKYVKIGNTDFRVDVFKIKTKADFVKIYADKKTFMFDHDEAWNFLRQFVKKDAK